mgnify:CR=1 FL=1
MAEENTNKNKYDVALATRNFEIELFWKRSLFFWGFIASAIVGYATLIKDNESLAVVVACFGFVCSVAWSLANRGSKYWQENWESIVAQLEDDVTGKLFKSRAVQQKKGVWLTSRKFSVSKVTIALSDFTVLMWLSLIMYHLVKEIVIAEYPISNCLVVLVVVLSILFAIIMAIAGRSSEPENS